MSGNGVFTDNPEIWETNGHTDGRADTLFFDSYNPQLEVEELKDADSRNEKKIREKKFGRGDLVTIERVDFRVKKLSFSFFCLLVLL